MLGGLLAEVEQGIRRYIVARADEIAVCALWVAHTHVIEAADVSPYLSIVSPEKGSGKTHLLKALSYLAREPLNAANISDAALFRAIEQLHPTLFLDEVDTVFGSKTQEREGLRGLLNAGYERGEVAIRMGGARRDELQFFEVFGAKAFAGIGKLPSTIRDRSIEVRLKRKKAGEGAERFLVRNVKEQLSRLQEQLVAWADDNRVRLIQAEPVYLDGVDDRACDLWEPLARIASFAGSEWLEKARLCALTLSEERRQPEDDSHGVRLLADVWEVFGEYSETMASAELVSALNNLPESDWGGWSKGRGLSQALLAKMLRPYEIRPRVLPRGADGFQVRGYFRADFADAVARYVNGSGDTFGDGSVTGEK